MDASGKASLNCSLQIATSKSDRQLGITESILELGRSVGVVIWLVGERTCADESPIDPTGCAVIPKSRTVSGSMQLKTFNDLSFSVKALLLWCEIFPCMVPSRVVKLPLSIG
jgi:hypothetical protein